MVFDLLCTRVNAHFLRRISPMSSSSWTVTNMSESFSLTLASSVVSIGPFAAISVVGTRTLTVSNSSGDKPVLLMIRTEAPASAMNSLSSGLTVEVDAPTRSNLRLKKAASFPEARWGYDDVSVHPG